MTDCHSAGQARYYLAVTHPRAVSFPAHIGLP